MFSVVIPLFNKSAYIEKCLKSVLAQKYKQFELIVINDGSTDDGPEKVKAIIAQNTRFPLGTIRLLNQPNKGVSVTRNNAVKIARYEYIAFLDADDWWNEYFLEEMKSLIDLCPEAKLYGSNYFYVKAGKNRLENKGLADEFTLGYINYIATYASTFVVPINCSFAVVQKEAFLAEGGFKPNLKLGEDFDLWLRLALKYKVAYFNKPLAFSNQDVNINQRALGKGKKWKTSEHFIFNLEYLEEEEQRNHDLKKLLNGLRVRSLIPFWINGLHAKEVTRLLEKIDFQTQSPYFNRVYHWPLLIVKTWFRFLSIGSFVKRRIKLLLD